MSATRGGTVAMVVAVAGLTGFACGAPSSGENALDVDRDDAPPAAEAPVAAGDAGHPPSPSRCGTAHGGHGTPSPDGGGDDDGNAASGTTPDPDAGADATECPSSTSDDAGTATDAATAPPDASTTEPDASTDAGAPPPPLVALPPGFQYCTPATPCGTVVPRVNACPQGAASCTPARTTTVEWTVNGTPFNVLGINFRGAPSTIQIVSGPATIMSQQFATPTNTPRMTLGSDLDVTLTYYDDVPVWGGTTLIPFDGTFQTTAHGSSSLFGHASYDLGTTHATVAQRLEEIAVNEIGVASLTPPPFRAFLMPTEMAIVLGGEGDFSFGDGTIAVNYGNPDFIATAGGVLAIVSHEFAHEHSHLLFHQIANKFVGNPTCFDEGLADGLGNFLGYVPDSDLGAAQDGSDFTQGCTTPTEIHAKGNCVFWNLKRAGYFTRAMFTSLFAPQHTYGFDSCNMTASTTGNTYVVYLTEATGTDMSAFVTSIGLTNAGSYAAAKAALGL
jgi:hypothetical protein